MIALLLLDVTHKAHKSNMAFSILAAIVRLHIMNYTDLSAIIEAYKSKRTRPQAKDPPAIKAKATSPPAIQMNLEM